MNKIIHGNCLEELKNLEENSIDSIVTDPPYELGFMGKSWDNTGIANNPLMWAECLRVLKPGGYLLSFGGTRTYHRMACAIEDAGFEVRDMIEWVYGSGFPKSLNIGKAVSKLMGEEVKQGTAFKTAGEYGGRNLKDPTPINDREQFRHKPQTDEAKQWEGWGTALKPAHEPICMARKPLGEKTIAENVLKYGTGGINIDESRVGGIDTRQKTGGAIEGSGWGTKGGAIAGSELGRFPANLLHDNSEEVRECFPETKSQGHFNSKVKMVGHTLYEGGFKDFEQEDRKMNDSGNASRFFKSIIYQAKASKSERNKGCEELEEKQKAGAEFRPNHQEKANNGETGNPFGRWNKVVNNHPTVKPIALMEYLIKMVTPPIVFVCEKCYNGKYEKQKTNGDTTQLSNLRDRVQTTGQSTQGEVLHEEVCISGGENNNRKTVPILQEDVSTQKNRQESTDLLQSPMLGDTHRNNEEEQRTNKNTEGLFSDLQTREQDVKQARNGIATPIDNGGTHREGFTPDRNNTSQEPQKGRQQGREFTDNDSKGTQYNSETKEKNNLSSLSGNRRCPDCGESMVKRAGVVLDPFAGSGSTLVAAKQNGYQYVGIEMTEEYIPIIEARLK